MNNPNKTNNEERRSIDSYFFSLKETGNPKIDAILYTLADVAERLHHTKQWEDEGCIDEIQKAADDAARVLSAEPVQDIENLFGPYGYINGHRALSEDSWAIESDPLNNDEEYFSIPLYAKVDPFKIMGTDIKIPSEQGGQLKLIGFIDHFSMTAIKRGADFSEITISKEKTETHGYSIYSATTEEKEQ